MTDKPGADMPDNLSPEAAKHWPKVAKQLEDAGVLTKMHGAALGLYCEAFARWKDANDQVLKHGTVVKSPSGSAMQSPFLAIANKAHDQMVKLLIEFGMTPNAKGRRMSAEVIQLPATMLPLNTFCSAAAVDHATVSRRLKLANIAPAGKRGKLRLYRLADLLRVTFSCDANGRIDPDRLDPFRRKAHYQSESEKLKIERDRGELIPRIEVEDLLAHALKILGHDLDVLPDILERDCGATPQQLAKIEAAIDAAREQIYERLAAAKRPQDAPAKAAPV